VTETVVIPSRYNGPTGSGQGGYVGGILARGITGAVEVTLRLPPPLDVPLTIEREADGAVSLHDGEDLVAEARPAELELEIPPPPTLEEALAAAQRFPFHDDHPLPTCIGCGNTRAEGDGLRLFPGRVEGRDMVAAVWRPHPSLAGPDGRIGAEMIWTAIDCPGSFAILPLVRENFPPGSRVMLGRCVTEVANHVAPERPSIVMAWPLRVDGRKLYAGSALFSEEDALLGATFQTWIVVLPEG
jgi:hypothetical protein